MDPGPRSLPEDEGEVVVEEMVGLSAAQKRRLRKKKKKMAEKEASQAGLKEDDSSSKPSSSLTDEVPISLSELEISAQKHETENSRNTPETAGTAKRKRRRKKVAGGGDENRPVQTDPPSVSVLKLFPSGNAPVGEIQEYREDNLWRITNAELREKERLQHDLYNDVRLAAEAHRTVRQWAVRWIRPGLSMTYIADTCENKLRELIEAEGLARGLAFPCGVSLNHVAAHYTPNAGDKLVLGEDDVLKLDMGVHIGVLSLVLVGL